MSNLHHLSQKKPWETKKKGKRCPDLLALFKLTCALLHQGPEDAPSEQETTDSQGETEESVPAVSRLPSSHTQPLRKTYSLFLHIFFSSDVIKKKKNQYN